MRSMVILPIIKAWTNRCFISSTKSHLLWWNLYFRSLDTQIKPNVYTHKISRCIFHYSWLHIISGYGQNLHLLSYTQGERDKTLYTIIVAIKSTYWHCSHDYWWKKGVIDRFYSQYPLSSWLKKYCSYNLKTCLSNDSEFRYGIWF